jgi:transglutaminase-like putative cysteine protease
MRLLTVHHETCYRYPDAVQDACHLIFLRPCDGPFQRVLSHALDVTPHPEVWHRGQDCFGNWRDFLGLYSPHRSLTLTARSRVQSEGLSEQDLQRRDMAWREVRERLRFAAGRPALPASEFAFASPLAPVLDEVRDYALEVFDEEPGLIAASLALCRRIHREFRYVPQSTQIDTPALQSFRRREGVCQDFSHLMVIALRGLGLSARYVSGYLLTRPPPGQPRRQGVDASHAWVSVYCPGGAGADGAWIELDPTNGLVAGDEHVRLAYGRDFGDVSPCRGVIRGGADHVLSVSVTVDEAGAS